MEPLQFCRDVCPGERRWSATDWSPRWKLRREFEIRRRDGMSVHHKYFAPRKTKKEEESGGTLLSCAHGFGANTYSYEMAFVDAILKKSENVGVVCYDSVGFGLTERPRTDLMKFTKVFNAKCLKAMAKKYASDGDSNNYTKKKKKKKKVVYVGHSLGAIAATLTTTLEDGDDDDAKPSAFILIAPAFLVKQEKQKKICNALKKLYL